MPWVPLGSAGTAGHISSRLVADPPWSRRMILVRPGVRACLLGRRAASVFHKNLSDVRALLDRARRLHDCTAAQFLGLAFLLRLARR
jgi:hypothetical protein